MSTQTLTHTEASRSTALPRALVATYALAAYAIGTGSLFWVIFAAGGLAPHGLSAWQVSSPVAAIAINILLVVAFATQHTIMARKRFKTAVQKVIPQPIERSTYVLAAGIAMSALVYFWQSVPGELWAIESTLATVVIRGVYVIGIVYLLGSSFVTNHFELFGLRQAWLYCNGKEYTPVEFKQAWVYKYSRHPMMLGLLLAFWAAPDMSATRFVLSALLTCYIFVGIQFEERSLIQEFGDSYRQYRDRIGMFFTLK
jgi:protein-S-isoprenylcysteine O-methyltransferase Ste14